MSHSSLMHHCRQPKLPSCPRAWFVDILYNAVYTMQVHGKATLYMLYSGLTKADIICSPVSMSALVNQGYCPFKQKSFYLSPRERSPPHRSSILTGGGLIILLVCFSISAHAIDVVDWTVELCHIISLPTQHIGVNVVDVAIIVNIQNTISVDTSVCIQIVYRFRR